MSAGANPFQEQLRLWDGEELVASMDLSSASHVDLTNQRVIVWQRSGGLERVTPVKLSDVTDVELQEEGQPLWHLLGAVALAVAGGFPLAYATAWLPVRGEGNSTVLTVAMGVVGLGLVVAGLVLLSSWLRRVLFPGTQLVLRGAPELRINVSSEAVSAAHEIVYHIRNLKSPVTVI
ncbi:MAG: hypothetical protein QGH66_03160 [Dehalococcoidia bacterium]|jgi:hypothetical protein|nr:hypothetical protein [Dehalococcoidia bacterium]